MILNRLHSIFDVALDDRDPVHTFTIPGVEGSFGVMGSPLTFWCQIALTLAIQATVACTFGAIIYLSIVKQRHTSMASIIGYGAIIPAACIVPYHLVRLLKIQNMCVMVALASVPIVLVYRCLEALHGTTPSFLERDLQTYCGYYAAIVPFEYDPETGRPVKATSRYLLKKIARLFSTMTLIVIAYSLMMPHNYAPFPSPSQPQSFTSIVDWFHWGHLLNNLVVAGVTSLSLDGGTLGVGLGISLLSGCRTISVMDSPILCSTSPSDFWSLRWNRLVHELLKRGVYLPCRQYGPRSVAAIVTFLASGVLHEYVLSVISWKGRLYSDPSNYVPLHGSHLLFFIWNGMVMLAEYAMGGTAVMNGVQKFPRPVLTCLTLMTVLPVSHLFTDEYIASGFFSDYSIGYPIIIHLP